MLLVECWSDCGVDGSVALTPLRVALVGSDVASMHRALLICTCVLVSLVSLFCGLTVLLCSLEL